MKRLKTRIVHKRVTTVYYANRTVNEYDYEAKSRVKIRDVAFLRTKKYSESARNFYLL